MARGTRLFQAPRSPLIQGRSREVRPWWQPFVVAVLLGLAWPIASSLPHEIAEAGRGMLAEAISASLATWARGLVVLVPSVLVGASIGLALAAMWGTRLRWIPATVAGIGAWYAALVVAGLLG